MTVVMRSATNRGVALGSSWNFLEDGVRGGAVRARERASTRTLGATDDDVVLVNLAVHHRLDECCRLGHPERDALLGKAVLRRGRARRARHTTITLKSHAGPPQHARDR